MSPGLERPPFFPSDRGLRERSKNAHKNGKKRVDSSSNILKNYLETDFVIKRREKVLFIYNLLYRSIINKKYTLFNLISTNEKIFKKYDDNKIKKLGYSILRKDNKIIKNLDDLNIDDKITIDMFRGNIKAKIKELND